MKKLKKIGSKILASSLSLFIMLSAVNLPVNAETRQITTALDFTNKSGDESGDGWSWDNSNSVLTLDGLDLSVSNASGITVPDGTTITLQAGSTNTIICSAENESAIVMMGSLTINGAGTLKANSTVSGGFGIDGYINVSDKVTLTIDSAVVEASCVDGENANGIGVYGSLDIKGGAKVTAICSDDTAGFGIQTDALSMSGSDTELNLQGGNNAIYLPEKVASTTLTGVVVKGATSVGDTLGKAIVKDMNSGAGAGVYMGSVGTGDEVIAVVARLVVADAVDAVTIDTVAPVTGATIADGTNTPPTGINAPTVTWSDDNGASWNASGNFKAGTTYQTKYVYTAKSGYVFDCEIEKAGITATNKGAGTVSAVRSDYDKTLTVTVTWPATEVATADVLTGNVAISGTLKYNQLLTATYSGGNNTGTLSYQWKRDGSNISGATNSTYTTVADDIGKILSCEVTSSVETGSVLGTATTAIAKADSPVAPSATFSFDGNNTNKLMGATTAMEYSLDGGSTYTDCTADMDLTAVLSSITAGNDIKVRVKETVTTKVGAVQTINITTGSTVSTVTKEDCTTADNNDGKLIGVTSAMEYRLKNTTGWTQGTGSNITVSNGDYEIRYRASGTSLAGDIFNITVAPYTPHTHVADTTWHKDDTSHWHECTAGDGHEMDKASHTYGAWVTDTEATEAIKGSRHKDCTVCNHRVTEEIPVLPHTHVADTTWHTDDTNHWHECTAGDGHEMDKASHTYGEWITDTQATETTKGSKHRDCTVCNHRETVEIPTLEHTHVADTTTWFDDDTHHWHKCTANDGEEMDKATHSYGEWVTDTEATETAKGSQHRDCTVCNHRETEEIPMLEHTHIAGTDWYKDDTNHWHLCTAGDNHKMDVSAHSFGDWVIDTEATATTAGSKHRDCVCGQTETEEIPATGVTAEKPVITAGAGSTHQISNGKDMTLTCTGKLEDLEGIYVDGKLVDASNYTLKSGSTILTLKASYLDTLSAGSHTLKFQYKDNLSADTTFTVTAKAIEPAKPDTTSPKTGDTSNTMLYFSLIVLSGCAVTFVFRRRKSLHR